MIDNLIIDAFAGGGGASVGIEMALGRPVDIAINHDPDAILMHKTNHPGTLHLTEDIFKVDLQKYVGGRHAEICWEPARSVDVGFARLYEPFKSERRSAEKAGTSYSSVGCI